MALRWKELRPPMYLPASVCLNGTSLSHMCLKNRTKSLTLVSVVRDNFRKIFPKYTSRANTVISEHRLGRTSRPMGNPLKSSIHSHLPYVHTLLPPPFFFSVLPSKVQNYLLKSVFKMGSVVSPNPEIN